MLHFLIGAAIVVWLCHAVPPLIYDMQEAGRIRKIEKSIRLAALKEAREAAQRADAARRARITPPASRYWIDWEFIRVIIWAATVFIIVCVFVPFFTS